MIQYPTFHEQMKFAILLHYGQEKVPDHLDFLFEMLKETQADGCAITKFQCNQTTIPQNRILVGESMMIPRTYLNFEGAMTRDRGLVTRVATGHYHINKRNEFTITSDSLSGTFAAQTVLEKLYLTRVKE